MEEVSLRVEIDDKTNALIWLSIVSLCIWILAVLINWIMWIKDYKKEKIEVDDIPPVPESSIDVELGGVN